MLITINHRCPVNTELAADNGSNPAQLLVACFHPRRRLFSRNVTGSFSSDNSENNSRAKCQYTREILTHCRKRPRYQVYGMSSTIKKNSSSGNKFKLVL